MSLSDANANALLAYNFWKPLTANLTQTYAILGCIDGECSFNPHAVGDHGEAFGIGQWHKTRADLIRAGCGVDVAIGEMDSQLIAMHWEMSDPKSTYRHVLPLLLATETLWAAMDVLVTKFEQSANRGRDINRRCGLALGWQKVFEDAAK